MKKTVVLIAALASMLASCTKSEITSPELSDINLHINVAELDAGDTKAYVKTGWVENDCISIWYDSNVTTDPNIVIKYDGSEWIKDEYATITAATPSASGYVKAVYNGNVAVASKDNYTLSGDDLYWNFPPTPGRKRPPAVL